MTLQPMAHESRFHCSLTGATDEVVAVHKRLSDLLGLTLPDETFRDAVFPPPTVNDLSDAASAHLLWQATRLTLREGATPFRSLGRVSIRPRVYQFVPLLMALRLDPVRILIADDVGVGKTIEALLIARELLDRGEIRRLCVLCPPYLCEQWHKELTEKFNLDAVVIRAGTIGQLERRKTGADSIFLMEEALTKGGAASASRCGVIRTRAVSRLTTILLLRIRYLLQQPERAAAAVQQAVNAGIRHSPTATPSACCAIAPSSAARRMSSPRPARCG